MKKMMLSTILAIGLAPVAAMAYTVSINGGTAYTVTSVSGDANHVSYTGTTGGGGGSPVAPVIISNNFSKQENSGTFAGTVQATDGNGDGITFSLSGGVDQARFSLSTGGALSFLSAPDFEAPADSGGNNVYNINVTATDNSNSALSSNKNLAITVSNDTSDDGGGGGGGSCGALPSGFVAGTNINFGGATTQVSVPVEQHKTTVMAFTSTTDPGYLGQFSVVPKTAVQGHRKAWVTDKCPGSAGSDYDSVKTNSVTAKCAIEAFNVTLKWRQQASTKCNLQLNKKYYLNVKAVNCPTSTCNAWLDNFTN